MQTVLQEASVKFYTLIIRTELTPKRVSASFRKRHIGHRSVIVTGRQNRTQYRLQCAVDNKRHTALAWDITNGR